MVDKIEKNIPGVQKNVSLKEYTTYKIGGPAKYFLIAKTKEELSGAISVAKKLKLRTLIIGGGSNLLVSDKGFAGLVIKIGIDDMIVKENKIHAGAGVLTSKLAYVAAENGLSGFEWAAGIPATLGGCIYGHAQAFGVKTSDIIESVEAIDIKTLKIKNFFKDQCRFSLKNSIFKKNKNLIIISANLVFNIKDKNEIEEKIKEFINYRKERHPGGASAGSTFVNPEKKIKNKKLLQKYPELNEFNVRGVIPAGFLIQKSGLQGKKIGGAQISNQHANFIINTKNAKAKDVITLIKLAKQKVKKNFGINLEAEVQLIGF